jgi:uncharacterized Zn-binding protein involved in type VI secretion
MRGPAARMGDNALNDGYHCHAPHPTGMTVSPIPHPPLPIPFVGGCQTVRIGGKPALRVNDQTGPCLLGGCAPGSPARVAIGSMSVRIGGMPAARVTDIVSYPGCVVGIASPMGKIIGPGSTTVIIGG